MDFAFADDELGITLNLIALQTNSQPFTIHLYQHQGEFLASAIKFGNASPVNAQFEYFFDKAREEKTDLVLTPEYSCPWEIIHTIIADPQLWPLQGKLWAIGCESISPSELANFKRESTAAGALFHCEPEDPSNNKNFYDPLVYLCLCKQQGVDKLMVLIQFKTAHMGTRISTMERNNLIGGKKIWILRNSPHSHNFVSIICSEAMNFMDALLSDDKKLAMGWDLNPFYVYHPQANPDPTHEEFIKFRKFVMNSERKEIISLNWNAGSKLGRDQFLKNGTARSGIYTQSQDLDLSESRVRFNHKNGLYYFSFGIMHHVFFLNSQIVIMHLSETRLLITGASASQTRKDGPSVKAVEMHDPQSGQFFNSSNNVTDSHISFLTELHCGCDFLMDDGACIFEKERLVCISCGLIKKNVPLAEIKGLFTFKMAQDNEPNIRITVDDDERMESQGKKSLYIDNINTLIQNIVPDKSIYPESLRDLKNVNITIGFGAQSRQQKYKYNVVSKDPDLKPTTMIYIGGLPDKMIKQTFDDFQSLFDDESPFKRRVVVYYKRGTKYLFHDDPKAGSFMHTEEHDGPNILNT